MNKIKELIKAHPNIWEFILFNLLSNCATITNFVVMWLCTGVILKRYSNIPVRFFIFDYSTEESMMLCGLLSFLIATAAAQTVNFFVQKNFVFKSNVQFQKAIWKYIILAVALVIISTALPAYSQRIMIQIGIAAGIAPTLANIVNILVQVIISYPAMKFWIMPKETGGKTNRENGAERVETA